MMTYERNNSMDFIPGGDGSLVVFDPESGNTFARSNRRYSAGSIRE